MSTPESMASLASAGTLPESDQEWIKFQKKDQKKLALNDLFAGFKLWPVWLMLAYQDIKIRYRRSILGPFWITLSMAITVYSMGYLYSHLFRTDLQNYFPFLVGGMLAWSFISSLLTELVETLITEENRIKQIKLPYSLYINKVVARNFIIFFHNLPILFPILILFHETAKINVYTLILLPSLLLLYLNALAYGLSLSMIGARFRDVAQIVKSLIQVVFFITPVLWDPAILPPAKQFIAFLNPFYAFIELIRCPLIGKAPPLHCWLMVAGVTFCGFALCFKMFSRYRSRIVYWL